MKRPVLIALIGYIIGILWGLYFKTSVAFLFVILWSIYLLLRKNRYIKVFMNYKLMIIITIFAITSNIIVNDLNSNYENKYKNIDKGKFEAIVVSNKKIKKYYIQYKIKVLSIDRNTKCKNTYLNLNVTIKNKTILNYGDKIEFIGEYEKPSKQRNFKGFDYSNYLKSIQVYGTVKGSSIKVLEQNKGNVLMKFSNKIQVLIEDVSLKIIHNEDSRNLLLGILLGKDDNLSKDIKGFFKDSSLSHIMAVSGLHVSYVILGVSVILSKSNIYKNNTKLLTIVIIIFFMFLTNFSPSVVRAGIMAILVLIASIVHRKNDISTSISIALFLILINNPFSIMDIGLILSFFGTIGIILLHKNILHKISKKDKKEIAIYKNNRLTKLYSKIKEAIAISISAQIFILPCTVLFFNTVSTTFLFSNLLVGFIIGSVIILGFITIIISIKFMYIGKYLALVLNILLEILINISKFFSNIPFSKIIVTTPSITSVIIYYVCIILINYIYFIKNKEEKRYTQKKVLIFVQNIKTTILTKRKILIIIFIIFIIFNIIYGLIPKDLKIHFIDVGQGDSCLVITPKNKTILIDGGGSKDTDDFDVGENTLLPYLLDRKINKIDYILISHFDSDHVRCNTIFITEDKCKKCDNRKAI